MPTYEEIMNFAVEKEIEAAELYKKLGGMVEKKSAQVMFSELMEEEVKHKEFLQDMSKEDIPDLKIKDTPDLKISDYLVDVEFKPDMEYQDILIMAMKREESSVKLYDDMASNASDAKLKKLLNFMSQQESKHKLRLESEYDQNVLAEA
ncbi:rubrerythrin [Candidatus Poribacteria bacterium]|nr:rubrerythrin [Candidatus Poribacteria bacterium]